MSKWRRLSALAVVVLLLAAGCGKVEPTAMPVPATATQIAQGATNTPLPPPPTNTSAPPTETATPSLTAAPRPTSAPPTATPTDIPPTKAPPPPTAEAAISVAAIVADLEGLPIDEFFEASFRQLLLRDPDGLIDMGLAAEYGIARDHFTDLSDAHVRETQELEAAILDLLRSYDRASLTGEQQLSYDIYEWYLDDRVRGHEFMYDNYPVHSFGIWAIQNGIIDFLANTFPIQTRQDASDYVARLSQMDIWTEQLIEGLILRESAGVVPSRYIVQSARQQVLDYFQDKRVDDIVLYTSFRDRLDQVAGLGTAEKEDLLQAARAAMEESFIPAWQELANYLAQLETVATNDDGVWKFPDGQAYYAHILRSETTTEMTPGQVHELGLTEVARIQAEMRQVAHEELGYPADIGMAELIGRLEQDGEYFEGPALRAEYERLIAGADQATAAVVSLRPTIGVEIVAGPPGPAYYSFPTLDGSRPGAFYIYLDSPTPHYLMPSVTYHETIPGHHFQTAIALERDLPTFRRVISFDAYVEGWALYAERLAWEMGMYKDDPLGNLGRLQLELLRAARVVVDTGIHDRHWTWQQGAAYFGQALGGPPGQNGMVRYIVMPGQGASYTIGFLKVLQLRQRAQETLGDAFDLEEFHDVILGNGAMPLAVLERVVDDWIAAKLLDIPALPE